MAIGHQSFYQAQLTAGISDTDTYIPLDTVPTPSEGFLVIESTVAAKREIIYYTSKDGSGVTVPSGAGNGRGYDGTTAVSHLQNAEVIMAPVGAMFEELGDITVNSITIADTTSSAGWSPLGDVPDTVTANGNRSYDLVFNSNDLTDTITPGMRLRTARTVAAPDQCTSLNGTSQYWSKSSPSGMTFTDDFSVSAWVKLSSYGAVSTIVSRYNGTSGWQLNLQTNGTVLLSGYNASSANYSYVTTYQSIPLNKWVHISAQLDMSAFTATTTTSYVMIDGVDVPATVVRAGTNPTALVQAGNLEIGSYNGGTSPFPGKIAQVAIYSAKVTQATHLAAMNQGLTGSETNLISAYSFDGTGDDLSANNNDLTANGGAAATNDDSPFGNSGVSTTLDYAIVMKAAFSTNTTLTVQVPEGCTIPTTGGVSTVDYSTQSVPYGFPRQSGKWDIQVLLNSAREFSPSSNTWFEVSKILVPTGSWLIGYQTSVRHTGGTSVVRAAYTTLSETTAAVSKNTGPGAVTAAVSTEVYGTHTVEFPYSVNTATINYLNAKPGLNAPSANGFSVPGILGPDVGGVIFAKNAYL